MRTLGGVVTADGPKCNRPIRRRNRCARQADALAFRSAKLRCRCVGSGSEMFLRPAHGANPAIQSRQGPSGYTADETQPAYRHVGTQPTNG